ncbi:hypothetical protein [Jidongwangia harbinensis]|uniref:hypothetical protein n=1 Tax=Jidongwangia harbinensis TaxID=2878561 RepID=UPI001CD93777|nr:hypothetical protein [Jidongwangia harbinensis]MCA2215757.1 hypothetical protein [Jidongwangia harbinensis]
MSAPNIGPEMPDSSHPDAVDHARKGNPASMYRDEPLTDDVHAASTRASAVTHRFGGVRYALSRPETDPGTPSDGGDPRAGE